MSQESEKQILTAAEIREIAIESKLEALHYKMGYEVVIPTELLMDDNLEKYVIRFYGVIRNLMRRKGYCWASNETLAQLFKVSESTIKRWIKVLVEKNFIETEIWYHPGSFRKERRIWISEAYLGFKNSLCRLKNEPIVGSGSRGERELTIGSRSRGNVTHNIKEIELEDKKDIVPTPSQASEDKKSPPKEAIDLSKKLFEKIAGIHPNAKTPNFDKWASHLDKLNRIDGKSWEEIDQMIDWAFEDKFWFQVLQSTEKLRENWDKMAIQKLALNNKANFVARNRAEANEAKSSLKNSAVFDDFIILSDRIEHKRTKQSVDFNQHPSSFVYEMCNIFKIRKS